jgi:hypothetical protein
MTLHDSLFAYFGRRLLGMGAWGALWTSRRTWQVEGRAFPPLCGVAVPKVASATIAQLLLETGVALTPAKSLYSPSAWFALFRYADAFAAKSTSLRLVAGAENWESRITSMLAEELGVGVAIHLARSVLGVVHVADFEPLLSAGEFTFVSPPVSAENPEARPDYLGILPNGQGIVFEAKGAVGAPGVTTKPLKKAKIQVRNVSFVRRVARTFGGVVSADRIAIATNFCIEGVNNRSETTSVLLDPPAPRRGPAEETGDGDDMGLRLSYAKAFNFADAPVAAHALVDRRDVALDAFPTVNTRAREHVILGAFPWGGVVTLDAKVARAIQASGREDLRRPVAEALAGLAPLEGADGEGDLVLLNNGLGLLRL